MGILRTDKISGLETPTAVTGSVYFDGTNDNLTIPAHSDLDLSSGDFTVEGFVYPTRIQQQAFVNNWNALSTGQFQVQMSSAGFIQASWAPYSTSVYAVTGSTAMTANSWYHFAYTRNGSTFELFLNGISQGTQTSSNNASVNSDFILGENGSTLTRDLQGYLSNVRVLKGTALYTSNFTPPTTELEVIGDTVLLCCNNPDSAGAEATGKTITVNGDAAASTFSPGLTRDFTFGTQFEGVSKFDTQGYFVPPSGTTEQRYADVASNAVDPSSARGLVAGGRSPGDTNVIDYITIATTGNAQDFGDLTDARHSTGAVSSSTRGIWGGGYIGSYPSPTSNSRNIIDYVIVATAGNAQDFGDLSQLIRYPGGISDSTRGVFMGGYIAPARINTIEYITMASTGDSKDFGDLSVGTIGNNGCGSPTRGIHYSDNAPGYVNSISYITIQSMGNAQDFGDATDIRGYIGSCSSVTRALFGGGTNPGPSVDLNTIDYVTIATTGNAVDFGDLTQLRYSMDATSSLTRGVFTGGAARPGVTKYDIIDYVTIASLGDAVDFGNLQTGKNGIASCSNGHGGLG